MITNTKQLKYANEIKQKITKLNSCNSTDQIISQPIYFDPRSKDQIKAAQTIIEEHSSEDGDTIEVQPENYPRAKNRRKEAKLKQSETKQSATHIKKAQSAQDVRQELVRKNKIDKYLWAQGKQENDIPDIPLETKSTAKDFKGEDDENINKDQKFAQQDIELQETLANQNGLDNQDSSKDNSSSIWCCLPSCINGKFDLLDEEDDSMTINQKNTYALLKRYSLDKNKLYSNRK